MKGLFSSRCFGLRNNIIFFIHDRVFVVMDDSIFVLMRIILLWMIEFRYYE